MESPSLIALKTHTGLLGSDIELREVKVPKKCGAAVVTKIVKNTFKKFKKILRQFTIFNHFQH